MSEEKIKQRTGHNQNLPETEWLPPPRVNNTFKRGASKYHGRKAEGSHHNRFDWPEQEKRPKPRTSRFWPKQPQLRLKPTADWQLLHFSAAAIILHLCEYLIQLRREQFPLFCQGLNSPGSTHARLRQIYAQSQKWYFRQIESTGICVVGHVCAVIKFRTYATLTLESNRNLDVYRVRF